MLQTLCHQVPLVLQESSRFVPTYHSHQDWHEESTWWSLYQRFASSLVCSFATFTYGLVTHCKPREGVLRGSVEKAVPGKGTTLSFCFLHLSCYSYLCFCPSPGLHEEPFNPSESRICSDTQILPFLSLALYSLKTHFVEAYMLSSFLVRVF
mgnify:CR=1 FL=1